MKRAIAAVALAAALLASPSALADDAPAIAVVGAGDRAPFAGVLLSEAALQRIERDHARDLADAQRAFSAKLAAAEEERKRAADSSSVWKKLAPLWTAIGAAGAAAVAGATAAAVR